MKMTISQLDAEVNRSMEKIGSWSRPLLSLLNLYDVDVSYMIENYTNDNSILMFLHDDYSKCTDINYSCLYIVLPKVLFYIEKHVYFDKLSECRAFDRQGSIVKIDSIINSEQIISHAFIPSQKFNSLNFV